MEMASTDEGRAKPKLLEGTCQKFVAASVWEIPYMVLLAFKKYELLKCLRSVPLVWPVFFVQTVRSPTQ